MREDTLLLLRLTKTTSDEASFTIMNVTEGGAEGLVLRAGETLEVRSTLKRPTLNVTKITS